jgi:hypothetical protein
VAAWLAAIALAGCPATTVHYGATVGTPWVAAGAVTGRVFAYSGRTLMDARVNGSDGLVLYTHGRTPDGATKILWVVRRRYGPTLSLRATRLDGSGTFTQRFAHGGGQFPSIIDIPTSGCWRLSLRTGKVRATFVVQAVDAPAESFCEPTPVFRRDPPHPRFGTVTWMPTTPRSNGIAAVLFVSTLPGADRALIYAGGQAPEGWSTKFLWWSPMPGGGLTLAGWRLDGNGTFKQTFQSAWSDDPPVTGPIFPSIVDIPTAGCWAVRVSTGGRTGLAVFNAVVTS